MAQQTARLHTGQRLTVEGRVQSRIYSKTEDGVTSDRTAYEVSVMRPAEREEFPEYWLLHSGRRYGKIPVKEALPSLNKGKHA